MNYKTILLIEDDYLDVTSVKRAFIRIVRQLIYI